MIATQTDLSSLVYHVTAGKAIRKQMFPGFKRTISKGPHHLVPKSCNPYKICYWGHRMYDPIWWKFGLDWRRLWRITQHLLLITSIVTNIGQYQLFCGQNEACEQSKRIAAKTLGDSSEKSGARESTNPEPTRA